MEWHGLANGLTNPRGYDYGEANLLFSDEDFRSIDWSAPVNIVCSHEPHGWSGETDPPLQHTVFKQYSCVRAEAVIKSDRHPARWVTLADRRWILQRRDANSRFNVRKDRQSGASGYVSDTIDGGTPWTWSGVVEELWGKLPANIAGAFPGLPYTPSSTPENLIFDGMNAWRAIHQTLTAIGCAVVFDPVAGTFTLCRLTENQPGSELVAQSRRRLLWSSGRYDSGTSLTNYPRKVVTTFPQLPQDLASSDDHFPFVPPPITKEAEITNSQSDTQWPVTDTMFGWSDRSAALQQRADEIRDAIGGQLRSAVGAFEYHYSGLVPFLTGSEVTSVEFVSDGDHGFETIIRCEPTEIDWPKLAPMATSRFGKLLGTFLRFQFDGGVLLVTHASPGYEHLIGQEKSVADPMGCILDAEEEDLEGAKIVAWLSTDGWIAENRCCIEDEE